MTLRHLSVFLCVCEEGNMTTGAMKLHIAQPSVSQTIAELERHYNVKLFERLGRKLIITSAGTKLATYARHIINLNQEAEDLMRELSQNERIRIGASATIGTFMLSDIIADFSKHNPNVKIVSAVNNSKTIEDMLLEDRIDIGLIEGNICSQGIIGKVFMNDELVLVCSAFHPLAERGKIEPEELVGLEFIVREEGSGTREVFETVMKNNGLQWQISGVYNNAEAIKRAVAHSCTLSVMSKIAIRKELKAHELVPLDVNGLCFTRQFSVVHHKNKYISPSLRKFIEMCLGDKVLKY